MVFLDSTIRSLHSYILLRPRAMIIRLQQCTHERGDVGPNGSGVRGPRARETKRWRHTESHGESFRGVL